MPYPFDYRTLNQQPKNALRSSLYKRPGLSATGTRLNTSLPISEMPGYTGVQPEFPYPIEQRPATPPSQFARRGLSATGTRRTKSLPLSMMPVPGYGVQPAVPPVAPLPQAVAPTLSDTLGIGSRMPPTMLPPSYPQGIQPVPMPGRSGSEQPFHTGIRGGVRGILEGGPQTGDAVEMVYRTPAARLPANLPSIPAPATTPVQSPYGGRDLLSAAISPAPAATGILSPESQRRVKYAELMAELDAGGVNNRFGGNIGRIGPYQGPRTEPPQALTLAPPLGTVRPGPAVGAGLPTVEQTRASEAADLAQRQQTMRELNAQHKAEGRGNYESPTAFRNRIDQRTYSNLTGTERAAEVARVAAVRQRGGMRLTPEEQAAVPNANEPHLPPRGSDYRVAVGKQNAAERGLRMAIRKGTPPALAMLGRLPGGDQSGMGDILKFGPEQAGRIAGIKTAAAEQAKLQQNQNTFEAQFKETPAQTAARDLARIEAEQKGRVGTIEATLKGQQALQTGQQGFDIKKQQDQMTFDRQQLADQQKFQADLEDKRLATQTAINQSRDAAEQRRHEETMAKLDAQLQEAKGHTQVLLNDLAQKNEYTKTQVIAQAQAAGKDAAQAVRDWQIANSIGEGAGDPITAALQRDPTTGKATAESIGDILDQIPPGTPREQVLKIFADRGIPQSQIEDYENSLINPLINVFPGQMTADLIRGRFGTPTQQRDIKRRKRLQGKK